MKRAVVGQDGAGVSLRRQCELVGLGRSSYYYEPEGETAENVAIMRQLDELYTRRPFYGSRRMTEVLRRQGLLVNRKRIQRLMRLMGLEAIHPKRHLSVPGAHHRVYPYLLKDVAVTRPNHVWAADITYIPMQRGFLYLVAVLDWYSRYVLSWRLSNTLEAEFCCSALDEALKRTTPEIFNTDQGSQFTSEAFTERLQCADVRISMDGRGRVFDNIFAERLWRSVKYEEVYLKDYQDGWEAAAGLRAYFVFYNTERPHQSLGYKTPAEVHQATAA